MIRPMAMGAVAGIALAMAVGSEPVAADGAASMHVEPAQANVAEGGEFTLRIVQDAPVATSGAEASVVFDPSILAVAAVSLGSAYADAPIVLPQDLTMAVKNANTAGRLSSIAAAYTPPIAVGAGPQDFLLVTFRAVGCGSTDLELPVGAVDASLIDGREGIYGNPVDVTTSPGRVTTCVDAAAVTPGISGTALVSAPKPDGGMPLALTAVGIAGTVALLGIGLVGGIAWRSRRREQPG